MQKIVEGCMALTYCSGPSLLIVLNKNLNVGSQMHYILKNPGPATVLKQKGGKYISSVIMSYNFCLEKCSTACHDSSYCYFISQSNAYQLRQDLLISGVVVSTDQINKDVRDPVKLFTDVVDTVSRISCLQT